MSSKSPTTIHYKYFQEPYLKGDDWVVIEPIGAYGVFRVPKDGIIEPLPPQIVNIATDFTTSVPALVDTGSPQTRSKKVEEIEMATHNLAQYWVIPLDPGVLFEFKQPSTVGRFANADAPISFDKSFIDFCLEHRLYNFIPQIWVFENQTPPTITATNEDMEEDTYDARIAFLGYRYFLVKQEGMSTPPVGQPYLPVRVKGVQ